MYFTYSNSLIQTLTRKYLLELLKRRSKFHQKNMSQQCALNFDKTLFENYKPIGVFIYKITENNCRLWYFVVFIQTQKRDILLPNTE